ncbi:dihydrolipoamide dehydrogenase [Planctopirus limnophila DSM 3776]|uniref:Dihydrolipoyl dehydrogenase n=1 Tax=Planctopirus limnophila (strain ATCC 43296 / DSM 3776 / IFAM 1008 / Mu 290) TaxID=521674 RepID=D5SU69_PLAL2|nr:dihydrolipoyl dehydrogenase [Planctopirus limnophila]ADG69122.1 dihydrolipoamide dehydrogenase [Planctopirus limnophila DSM 3776]
MKEHDLVVIGGGPGGYVAAIRAAQLGLNVACIEKESALGGTCLRVGCIPSKAMLESSELFQMAKNHLAEHGVSINADSVKLDLPAMLKRKDGIVSQLTKGIDGLFRKNKITRYLGHGKIVAPGKVLVEGAQPEEIVCKNIVIATGSKSAPLKGVEVDNERIGTSTEALAFPEVPGTMVVIGAGVIGLELGCVWSRLGAKVIVLEYLDRILPGMDSEIATEAQKIFTKQGIEFRLGMKVTGAKVSGKKCVVTCEGAEPITADRVLLAVGRIPNTENLNLDGVHVAYDNRGRIQVDQHFQTTIPGIYAIGDVIGGAMLAHKAEEEGMAVAEGIVWGHCHVNYDAIPAIVYTHPEIASVGKTEDQLKEAGVPYKKGSFPYMANGRAKAIAANEGRAKVLAHAETDRVLGVHIIGAHAGDLIAEAALAIEFGASSEDIARTSHAHPTLAEIVKEAALAVDGRAIHF